MVRTGPTSRPPQIHIALMGLLMVDDDLLSCKRRRDKLKRKEDNTVKAVELNPFKVTHLSNVACLVIGGVTVPSPRGSHTQYIGPFHLIPNHLRGYYTEEVPLG